MKNDSCSEFRGLEGESLEGEIISEGGFVYWNDNYPKSTGIDILNNLSSMSPDRLAYLFHKFYEELAPNFGYETREDTREFDPNSKNGKLMIATCEKILGHLQNCDDI